MPGGVDTWAGSTWWGCLSPTLGRSERLPGERGVFSVRSRAIQARGGTRSRGHHEGRGATGRERGPWEAPGSAQDREDQGSPLATVWTVPLKTSGKSFLAGLW